MSILLHPNDPYAKFFVDDIKRLTMHLRGDILIQVNVKPRSRGGYSLSFVRTVTLASNRDNEDFYSPEEWINIASRHLLTR